MKETETITTKKEAQKFRLNLNLAIPKRSVWALLILIPNLAFADKTLSWILLKVLKEEILHFVEAAWGILIIICTIVLIQINIIAIFKKIKISDALKDSFFCFFFSFSFFCFFLGLFLGTTGIKNIGVMFLIGGTIALLSSVIVKK